MGKQAIAVKKIDPDTGKVMQTYKSINEAARDNYTETTAICKALHGTWKHHLGYRWVRA